ncbi:MAG: cytosine permease [Cellulosilyticaceae bacterium]
MSREKKDTSQTEYEFGAVPQEQRKSYTSLTIVWTGYVFVVTSMMAGGGLAAGLNFKQIIEVCLLGNVFLGIIATLISMIASKNGLGFALLTKYSFGTNGSRIASFFVPVVNLGWYIIQAATYGHFIALIFHLGDVGEGICMILSALAMGIFAFAGMKAITVLGYVSIPAIVFLSIATSIKSVQMAGGIQSILSYTPSAPIAISTGVTAIIGTWILSTATCIADIMRYAKTTKEAVLSALTGLLLGNSLMIICGALGAIAMNNSDLTAVLLSMGLLIPSIILMTTNIFTTNAANLYSNSLNLSNSFNMDRKKIIIIILSIAALATLTKPYKVDVLFAFLNTLGNVIPPLAGIIIADYYIINKGTYEAFNTAKFKKWNIWAFATWLIALTLSFVLPGLPALTSLISSIIIFPILTVLGSKLNVKGGKNYEEI